jgi:energy-coupling factor transporter transmembrane protein EcfT
VSPLARRNPTIKLAVLTAVSIAAMFFLDPLTPTVLYALGLVAVAARCCSRTSRSCSWRSASSSSMR